MLAMIEGAAAELELGGTRADDTHVGPVIDTEAKTKLDNWLAAHDQRGAVRFLDKDRPQQGTFVAPAIVELRRAGDLTEEVFGPVLHVVRWPAGSLKTVLGDIAANGSGLSLGVHSRIEATIAEVAAALANGNVYVNRNMIGAVVGSQPFGGNGLSGTGPKAGGPNYLARFALEKVVTVITAASGG